MDRDIVIIDDSGTTCANLANVCGDMGFKTNILRFAKGASEAIKDIRSIDLTVGSHEYDVVESFGEIESKLSTMWENVLIFCDINLDKDSCSNPEHFVKTSLWKKFIEIGRAKHNHIVIFFHSTGPVGRLNVDLNRECKRKVAIGSITGCGVGLLNPSNDKDLEELKRIVTDAITEWDKMYAKPDMEFLEEYLTIMSDLTNGSPGCHSDFDACFRPLCKLLDMDDEVLRPALGISLGSSGMMVMEEYLKSTGLKEPKKIITPLSATFVIWAAYRRCSFKDSQDEKFLKAISSFIADRSNVEIVSDLSIVTPGDDLNRIKAVFRLLYEGFFYLFRHKYSGDDNLSEVVLSKEGVYFVLKFNSANLSSRMHRVTNDLLKMLKNDERQVLPEEEKIGARHVASHDLLQLMLLSNVADIDISEEEPFIGASCPLYILKDGDNTRIGFGFQ